ncbi:hypothetical protein NC652_037151 [Populus alba x Populus x berolinensis]|nr:hypothetical protein NC652_037151 [Populus alba x Populus x berolinensis]
MPPLPFGRPMPHRNCLPETVPWPGLYVQVQVVYIFIDMSISPSLSSKQCPDHFVFHALMASIHWGFGRWLPCHQVTNFLDLPALGRRQPPYMVLRLCEDQCFFLLRPSGLTRGSIGIFACCPSTTAFGLILGPDWPSVDEPCRGTLRFLGHWILTNVCVTQADILAFASGMLPYRCIFTSHSFGRSFSPVHLQCKSAGSVSYYALFQG